VPIIRNRFIRGNSAITHEELEFGGHLFPLEKPVEVAKRINLAIQQLAEKCD
jgi:hypothetical protein